MARLSEHQCLSFPSNLLTKGGMQYGTLCRFAGRHALAERDLSD
jgi:hypothetical protein